MEMRLAVLLVSFGILLFCGRTTGNPEPLSSPRSRSARIYTNQFAVHVPDGAEAAAAIADKHGFDNIGQVSNFCNLYKLGDSFISTYLNSHA